MAAPNIVNVATITGKTTSATPSSTSATVLLANAASSGKVFKIKSLIATNIDTSVAINTTAGVNSAADGSGTSTLLINTLAVPANAALIIIDSSTSIYLEENKSIVVTSGTASKISYTVAYEEIS